MSTPPENTTLLDRLFQRIGAGELGRRLASGASWVFGQKLYFILATLGVQILLSRTLGAERYGAYAFGLAWTQLLAIPALFGMDRVATRQVAGELTAHPDAAPWNFLHWSVRVTFVAYLVIALFAWLAGLLLHNWLGIITQPMRDALWAGIPLFGFFAFLRLRQGILLGRDQVSSSQAGELVIMPSVFLLFAGVAVLFRGGELRGWEILIVQALATAVATLVLWILSLRGLPKTVGDAESFEPKKLLISGRDLVAISLARTANTRLDILIVGMMLGAEMTAIYSVANRGAGILLQAQLALSLSLGPTLVRFHKEDNRPRMNRLSRKMARISFAVTSALALAMIAVGGIFLKLFGEGFIDGYGPLLVLGFGSAGVAFFGAVLSLLVMTNHERDSAWSSFVGLALMVALDLLLIPRFGMLGAAWATAISHVLSMALMGFFCWRRLGIFPGAFGPRELRGE